MVSFEPVADYGRQRTLCVHRQNSVQITRARSLHRKWSCISRTLGDEMLAARWPECTIAYTENFTQLTIDIFQKSTTFE